jgi:hypothetical protein
MLPRENMASWELYALQCYFPLEDAGHDAADIGDDPFHKIIL